MTTRSSVSFMFFIKRKKLLKNGEAPIFVRIRDNRQSVDLSILKSVTPKLWIAENGHASGNTKDAKEVNNCIERIRFSLNEHLIKLRDAGSEITAESIRDAFLGKETKDYLIKTYHEHNDNVRQLVGRDFAAATLERYEINLKHMKEFIRKMYKKEDIPVTEVDYEFITGFEHYLKTDRNCSHNTTMKYIKNFKKITRSALAHGWITKDPFADVKMNLRKIEKEYLTEAELNALIKHDSLVDRLQHVRDTFLFGCLTGLAYADLKKLTPDNLVKGQEGNYWIHTKRTKTDNPSHTPLLPLAVEIIEKYRDNPHCEKYHVLLPVYSNQKQNGYLKEIADICGIHKKLTTHVARHTFATTVTLNNDIPIETVSKMLGHSSIKMTQIYAKLLDKKVGMDMQKLHERYARPN